ncbi:MAG: nicotinate-nucleotide--dimethylbenzimidazole phosphoribosyltransferase [Gemmataceae bacterium]|nr:nicotinate-nucleotide--dimethylbenzimidazole phosphoribosyltransferase [Gemmataceae bacterium]MDW8267483.1 nicotinate-nucleotide--dimethylbenzimidazole phosphoribosyltransferase [Gemmataceae bacterium]
MTIPPLDWDWWTRAAEYQGELIMPRGALGRLLELGRQLCAAQRTLACRAEPAAVLVLAADHGIAAEGVSAYPQEVTAQMVVNYLQGTAAVNVLARRLGMRVVVADLGMKTPVSAHHPDYVPDLAVARGTANFLHGPAMTPAEVAAALAAGRRIVAERLSDVRVLALGEMGIGNTTSAAALAAALTGQPAEAVTGRGTGLDDAGYRHKLHVVTQAVQRHGLSPATPPLSVLAAVGGLEIAGLVGAAIEAAARQMLVVLDGFISSVAGLLAVRLEPALAGYLVAGHRSREPGHAVVLEALKLRPLLELDMSLGEGSGAVLAVHLIQSAADVMTRMATFDAAGVSRRLDSAPRRERADQIRSD